MLRSLNSLRFRLPAIFLLGVVLAGLVSTAIAVRLFQEYTGDRTKSALRREAHGVVTLYTELANRLKGGGFPAKTTIQEANGGDRIFYVPRAEGITPFPGQPLGLDRLPPTAVDWKQLARSRTLTFTLDRPGGDLLAVAVPFELGSNLYGSIVVGTPKAALRSRWLTLIERLALAFAGGVGVASALGWYLSRRITRPVLALSDAADEISRGHYDVNVPTVSSGDEIAHLADRFREMAARLAEAEAHERNFLMTVSHELRTPLTAIRGHVSALREGLLEDPALEQQSLAIVQVETERLERLVQDVLDLAKMDAHRFTVHREEVDMDRLVEHAYAAFAGDARRREIDYRRELNGSATIETDGDRVLQIITNLLANAFRWTPDGGRVGIELSAVDGTVSVAVEDTGPGIERAERERIFRPFFSRDDAGTGLGLAVARELAVALGGRIEVASEVGFGSRFELVLPARRQAAVATVYRASVDGRRSSIR